MEKVNIESVTIKLNRKTIGLFESVTEIKDRMAEISREMKRCKLYDDVEGLERLKVENEIMDSMLFWELLKIYKEINQKIEDAPL